MPRDPAPGLKVESHSGQEPGKDINPLTGPWHKSQSSDDLWNQYNIWKKVVKYNDDGMPFITADNRATLYCKHGADQNVKTKAEYTESVQS